MTNYKNLNLPTTYSTGEIQNMKFALQAKLLRHFASKKTKNGGFTLIELLVVIIIIGILAAIALPSFLNQASKAKQSEAKTYAGSVNRAQQAYRLENASFADSLEDLNIIPGTSGNSAQTDNYDYAIPSGASATGADVTADPRDAALRGYRGCVTAATAGGGSFDSEVAEGAVDTVPGSC